MYIMLTEHTLLFPTLILIVHYHFEGSYTASGDGDVNEGNLDSVLLAHKHDMGVL
jgi:hypothetical protein